MIVGTIVGRVSTTSFEFLVSDSIKKFNYVQVAHQEYGYILCQVIELTTDTEKTIAKCIVIGYSEDGRVKQPMTPLQPGMEVEEADEEFIKKVISLDSQGLYVGNLEGKQTPIYLEINKLLTKHVAVMAKSGSGKSYTVGVLLEELMDKEVPILIIDPHGEYSSLKFSNEEEKHKMHEFGIQPKNYLNQVQEYSTEIELNKDAKQLKLSNELTTEELMHLLPTRLSNVQQGILYSALKNMDKVRFDELIMELQEIDTSIKWGVISVVEYLKNFNLFADTYTEYKELIKSGKCTVINLRGTKPEEQEIIVYKLLKDLFSERKKNKIPPFFAIIEEAHNFCPEKMFGDKKSGVALRDIASEGRKFGLGLCVVTQRPARIEKNVLSQCTTQIILKVTNPNDLKAITNSVEGITYETENEIKNLPIGTAIITGITDMPLLTRIRTRKSKHGGEAVQIAQEEEKDFTKEIKEHKNLIPLILPKTTKQDLRFIHGEVEIKTYLIPAVVLECEEAGNKFNLLFDLVKGELIADIENKKIVELPDMKSLTYKELLLLNEASKLERFKPIQLDVEITNKEDIIRELTKKQIMDFDEEGYNVIEGAKFYLAPEKFNFNQKIEYEDIEYDKKVEKRKTVGEIKDKIKDYVKINNATECSMVYHKVLEKATSSESQ